MTFLALLDVVEQHVMPYFWLDGQNLVYQLLHTLVLELNRLPVPMVEQFVPQANDSLNLRKLRLQLLLHAALDEVDQPMEGSRLVLHVCHHSPLDYVLAEVGDDESWPMVQAHDLGLKH